LLHRLWRWVLLCLTSITITPKIMEKPHIYLRLKNYRN